jgi:hypothetical protein
MNNDNGMQRRWANTTKYNRQGFVGLEKPTMKPVLNGTGKYPPTMELSLKLFWHF